MEFLRSLAYATSIGAKHRPLKQDVLRTLQESQKYIKLEDWRFHGQPEYGALFQRATTIAGNANYFTPFSSDTHFETLFNIEQPRTEIDLSNPIVTGNTLHRVMSERLTHSEHLSPIKLQNPQFREESNDRDPLATILFDRIEAWLVKSGLRPVAVEFPMAFSLSRGGAPVPIRGQADALLKDSKGRLCILELKTHASQGKWKISDQPRCALAQSLLYLTALHTAGVPVSGAIVLHVSIAEGRVAAETHTIRTRTPLQHFPPSVSIGPLLELPQENDDTKRISQLEAAVQKMSQTIFDMTAEIEGLKNELKLHRAQIWGAPPGPRDSIPERAPPAVPRRMSRTLDRSLSVDFVQMGQGSAL
ncbi:PD-(D/E)XK nuclease superfamily [Carpediemonas membranifera]|uniref:PD-(D/E)XK nuclease superfamily n=1 Tax=Carpediemonas membranifera TaxID=201153 RepID=A0A8J6E3F0_9EUKA|nr:PD-(D/E)XK nuclease superfamily [Carpediemonas membranifera]|eukprot:KAG9393082.1 PD-(D/E)XK nuclease superfamily [Carpediemonas membranifera]